MIITITGTPGTGKTYFAKKLAKKMQATYLNLNDYIKTHKLYSAYDKKAKTFDVDSKTLKKLPALLELKKYQSKQIIFQDIELQSTVKNILRAAKKTPHTIIIDSHMSHYVKSDLCFVMTCPIKTLHTRLRKRNYPKQKIIDNVQSEIFEICLDEAKDLKRNVIIVENR